MKLPATIIDSVNHTAGTCWQSPPDRIAECGWSPRRPGDFKKRPRPAALKDRKAITTRDIALAAELALPHRIKRGPFQQSEMTMEELHDRIEQLQGASQSTGKTSEEAGEEEDEDFGQKKK